MKTSGSPWDTGKPRMDYGMTIPAKLFIVIFGLFPWIAGVILIVTTILELFGLL